MDELRESQTRRFHVHVKAVFIAAFLSENSFAFFRLSCYCIYSVAGLQYVIVVFPELSIGPLFSKKCVSSNECACTYLACLCHFEPSFESICGSK